MATIKKYIKPCITNVPINRTNILCSSGMSSCICSESCKYWSACQIRGSGKYYCLYKKI